MIKLRPCIVKVYIDDDSEWRKEIEKEAIFHKFGNDWKTSDHGGATSITVAIVELKETGEVRCLHPESVRFTDI
jgi:hypothetical protein